MTNMKKLSNPLESLIGVAHSPEKPILQTDFLVVGTGYGGAITAMRFGDAGRDVVMLERGRQYDPGDFPYDEGDLPAHMSIFNEEADERRGYTDALLNVHTGDHTDVMVGSGLGGTSLINANVAEMPTAEVFNKPAWPTCFRNGAETLRGDCERVRNLLGTARHPCGQYKSKYRALARLSDAIDRTRYAKARVTPANVAVRFEEGPNNVGVYQRKCTDCGNCVTGCNVGAKSTLDRNILPLAVSRGVKIYTGATVISLQPGENGGRRWRLRVTLTRPPTGTLRAESWYVDADHVILAAGTLGSSEILLRSRHSTGMKFSSKLGKQFSTNGDGLVMSYGQKSPVNAIAAAEQAAPAPEDKIGPTIIGMIRVTDITDRDRPASIVIEDASIPAALASLFIESSTTSAQMRRFVKRKLPPGVSRGADPLTPSRTTAQHGQALLVMGDDGARGELRLDDDAKGDETDSILRIEFPDVVDNPALVVANRLVKAQDRKAGLDGGQYAANPLWEPLPKEVAGAIGGARAKGRVVTVHPLGGCPMGDDIDLGVVDHRGRVFDPESGSKTGTYDGLYVCDGSIIPTALEINPFLTIAALAHRNAGLILVDAGWQESHKEVVDPDFDHAGTAPARIFSQEPVSFTIVEQLIGEMERPLPLLQDRLPTNNKDRLTRPQGFVLQVNATMPDVDAWADKPTPLAVTAKLYANPLSADQVENYRPDGVPPEILHDESRLHEFTGTFTLLEEDPYGRIRDWFGAARAMLAYLRRRGKPAVHAAATSGHFFRSLAIMWNIAVLQGRYRRMKYRLESPALIMTGEKVLGYDLWLPRMWPALLNMKLTIKEKRSKLTSRAFLRVNAGEMVKAGFLRLDAAPHLPKATLFATGIGAFMTRATLSTNFWEFAGTDYPEVAVKQETLPRALLLADGRRVEPQFETIPTPLRQGGQTYPLLMTHYENSTATRGPILLLHGLAQGSQVYWTDSIPVNLAGFMYNAGFDVWTADYRLSNHVLPCIDDQDWSMDEIASCDIPTIVDFVADKSGEPLTVFAHCVGACTFAMSILAGHTDARKIRRVAINAIHPWVIVSAANHVRADLGSFYRDWVKTSYLNPIPGPDDGVAETLLDRTAYTVSKLRELELDDHRAFGADPLSATVCDRMTLLYGRMWNHKNLSQETHKAFIHMMGTAPQGVYAHLYYYSLLNRLTDRHGDNVYLRRNNIETRWTFDTIFLHGNDSRVFNPYSAEKSAIRLREIVGIKHPGQYAFRSRVFDDYGHMDVIIGKHAYRDIFGDVLDFYDNQAGAQNEMDRPDEFPHRPRMGPFLRAAWLEDGRLRLRYWAELKVMLDRRQAEMDVAGSQVTRQAEACVTHVDSGNNRHRMIDVETCDAPPSRLSFELYGAMRAGLKVARSPQAGHGVVIEYADEAWYRRIVNVASGESSDQTTFLVGSCRFPGSVIDCDLTDRAYAAMHGHLDKAELLFLIGDQIYADATDQLFKVRSLRAKYRFRYQRAFDARYSPNFAALVRRIPTHFAIDDHEFADNWSGDPREPKDLTAAEKERVDDDRATMSYGLNNARRFQTSFRDQAPIGGGSAFYYALRHPDESSFPTFVMDTRSERQFRATSDPAKYRMIEKAQEDALLEWLCKAAQESPGAPKFIVSGSTLAPLPQRYVESPAIWRQLDGWAGYPETVEKVLYEIVANDIRNVVFVGGNEHFSAFARLCIKAAGREVTAWQVISSAFYAPMPFANSQANDYRWDVPVSWPVHLHQPMTVDYEARLLSTIGSQFMQVTASSRGLEMDLFNARDEKCRSASIDFASQMFSVRQ